MRFCSASTLCAASLLAACAPPNAATPYPAQPPEEGAARREPASDPEPQPQGLVKYFDRELDLQPFLVGYPYDRFRPSLKTGKVFFYEKGDRYTLRMLDVGSASQAWDPASAPAISDVDWSKRSLWSIHHHAATGKLWLHADAGNDEQMNLWTLDLNSQSLEQVTFHDYLYGYGFSEDERKVAYLPRAGKKAPFSTCLRVRDVASGEEREVVCDSPALRFTWSSPRFSPDGHEVWFNAQIEGDRNRVQLVRVDLRAAKPKVEVITNPRKPRNSPGTLEDWIGDELLFLANDDGFYNLYAVSRTSKKIRRITRFTEDIVGADLTDAGVVAVHRTPAGSTLVLVDPRTGTVLDRKAMPGSVDLLDAHGNLAIIEQESPDIVHEAYAVDVSSGKLVLHEILALPEALEAKVVQCKATPVKIPTFDVDPQTGKTRLLHAFLLEPRVPPENPSQRLGLITAFYGGANTYSTQDQIFCAAGLTVVSPSVRGSSGFGKAFYSLNDKDLGGDEIIDLFYVARWLAERTGLPERRIGVYGGSHGGYATMRALTFPPETNGRNEFFPFGFGLAHAGFSSIKTFYDATNIPDWVVLESGDPNVPADLAKMLDRSPLTHVDRLQAPLLLTHGSKDWRVPVEESRQFVEAARQLERPVVYVEIEGQGHHIEGLSLQVELHQARFDFLMAVAEAAP